MSSNRQHHTLTYKGTHHHSLKKEGWLYPWLGDVKFAKKQARRAQRRDNHKEIEAQLADAGRINTRWTVNEPEWYAVEKGIGSIFSPIPEFAMTDWERGGMEYFRRMKSIFAMNRGRGLLAWKRQEIARRRYIDTDETLFEALQRSVNRS